MVRLAALSLVLFLIVYFAVIRPDQNTANQAVKTGLQQSQQVINQAKQQLSTAGAQASGQRGRHASAATEGHQPRSGRSSTKAQKLTACVASAATDPTKLAGLPGQVRRLTQRPSRTKGIRWVSSARYVSSRARPSRDLLEHGLLGRGIITAVKQTGVSTGVDFDPSHVCVFTVEVSLDNTARYIATCRQAIRATILPQLLQRRGDGRGAGQPRRPQPRSRSTWPPSLRSSRSAPATGMRTPDRRHRSSRGHCRAVR